MKTAVLMKRELFGSEIAQNSKTEMFSATDLTRVGNKWRIANDLPIFTMKSWLANKGTKEFIEELTERYGKGNVKKSARGKGCHTWFHPLLFIDMALAINPKLKIEVYQWLFDNLIKHRNESGTAYTKMAGTLYKRTSKKTAFPAYIQSVAEKIKLACHVTDWNGASEEQLKQRGKLQENIALLAEVLNNNDEAVRIAILKSKELIALGETE